MGFSYHRGKWIVPVSVVFIYHYAVELHLKAMILGEGHNFLTSKPYHLSINET
jgi:hypothetical protein